MVSPSDVQSQLKRLGVEFKFFGKAEINELQHILVPGEEINHILNGRYAGGFAVLCTTNQRVLLIDKKPLYLTLEDIRYDMISEVDYSHRLVDSTIILHTFNKTLQFTSIRAARLRAMTAYTQLRVMEIRQQQQYQPPQQLQVQPSLQPDYTQQVQPGWQPQAILTQTPAPDPNYGVQSFQHSVINPYTKTPLMMRRRVSRFY